MLFPADLIDAAVAVLERARGSRLRIITAESCTGGLVAGLLTEIPGSSDVIERGLVTYSNDSKIDLLGVDPAELATHGAVSAEIAAAMARGALDRSPADLALAVTGIAGPGGATAAKPIGLVYIAGLLRSGPITLEECRFGDVGRTEVRVATLRATLALADRILG